MAEAKPAEKPAEAAATKEGGGKMRMPTPRELLRFAVLALVLFLTAPWFFRTLARTIAYPDRWFDVLGEELQFGLLSLLAWATERTEMVVTVGIVIFAILWLTKK